MGLCVSLCLGVVRAEVLTVEPIHFQSIDYQREKWVEANMSLSNDTLPLAEYQLSSVEAQITKFIRSKQWDALIAVLYQYAQHPNKDIALYYYALGALQRAEGLQSQAIHTYQVLTKYRSDLIYSQYDLALMLMEDYQYQEAKKLLTVLIKRSDEALSERVYARLRHIEKQQSWQPFFDIQYVKTDNVNNAATSPVIVINGKTFVRDEESRPKSAHGVSYTIGATRRYQIIGHHHFYTSLGANGTYYWDAKDYREESLQTVLGYVYKNIKQEWRVLPFWDHNRLGGHAYSRYYGVRMGWFQKLGPKWWVSGSYQYRKTAYFDEVIADRYNARQHWILMNQRWLINPYWMLSAGVDYTREYAFDPSLSSRKKGVSAGVYYEKDWGAHLSAYYGWRHFDREHVIFDLKRKDKERHVSVSLWHKSAKWKGIQPTINYTYRRIKSNLSDLYDRSESTVLISFSKTF
ncbi:surface lipoprotein assembly modifier [Basilea psittacipulmonis]|uniref:TPR repeat-containing protein n=1 Tax=Basilea psittacipulmonis DSM 24701 TaxID=1072685 RepID=A0A077DBI2_9BURK|nr:surface lipoprotein assembly modifier [Basilea psittacipulmonis]AIL32200.1 hypothetical protein IX83_01730 [Basilea psittacipulmonis DSM 24701]